MPADIAVKLLNPGLSNSKIFLFSNHAKFAVAHIRILLQIWWTKVHKFTLRYIKWHLPIIRPFDEVIRLMSSCNCEHSDWLRTLPETLVVFANLRMEFLKLLFTKRLGNVSATCNVSVSVSSRTHNVSSLSRLGHSSQRLGLAHLRLGSRLGHGRKGLVHIPRWV